MWWVVDEREKGAEGRGKKKRAFSFDRARTGSYRSRHSYLALQNDRCLGNWERERDTYERNASRYRWSTLLSKSFEQRLPSLRPPLEDALLGSRRSLDSFPLLLSVRCEDGWSGGSCGVDMGNGREVGFRDGPIWSSAIRASSLPLSETSYMP